MTRSPDEPHDSDAGAAARPTKRVISWRSRGGRSSRRAPANDVQPVPISTTAAPAAQASWRGGIDPQDRFRSRWLMARRIILTAASLALILLLVRMLLTVRRQVPIVVGFVTSYRFPLAPIALADEDRALIASLGTPGKRFYEPGTAAIFDVSPALASANADELLATLTATLRRVKPGGPDGDMAIVYLTAIGTLDDAIAEARRLADLDSTCRVVEYDRPRSPAELALGVRLPSALSVAFEPRIWALAPGHEAAAWLALTEGGR